MAKMSELHIIKTRCRQQARYYALLTRIQQAVSEADKVFLEFLQALVVNIVGTHINNRRSRGVLFPAAEERRHKMRQALKFLFVLKLLSLSCIMLV